MSFIVNEPVEEYAAAHTTPVAELFQRLAAETREKSDAPQMMVGLLEGRFLEFLVRQTKARRILELGTFTGWSSISMALRACRGRPDHDLRRQRGHDRDRAALCGGGRRRRPHRVPARSRARDDRVAGRAVRPDLHRRGQGELRQLLRGRAAEARGRRLHHRRQRALVWTSRRSGERGRKHAGDSRVQRPRAGRRARRMRDAQRARRDDADPQEVTLSTVRSSSESSTTSASASASSSGGKWRFGIATTRHSGGVRRADAVVRVLDRGAVVGRDAQPARRLEVDVRRRLAASDLLRRDRHLEVTRSARQARARAR